MTNQTNIGRMLTSDELEIVAAYHNWSNIDQDYNGSVDHDGVMATQEQIMQALEAV